MKSLVLGLLVTALELTTIPAESAGSPSSKTGHEDIGGQFTLTNHDGITVTEDSLQGHLTLLYFGFTFCPDICPTDLTKIARVEKALEEQSGEEVIPVFVTVDPRRDTPELLKGFVKTFSPDFVGLTGTDAQISEITDRYHVYYKKVPYGDNGMYTMEHSTFMFLLDSNGKYLDHFGRSVPIEQIVSRSIERIKGS